MTLRQVHRPTRVSVPLVPEEPEVLAAPPTMPDGNVSGRALQTLIPVVGASSSVILMTVLRNSNPLFLVLGAVVLVLALVGGVGIALTQRGGAARSRRAQRELYLDFLEKLRVRLRERGRGVRDQARTLDPAPAALLELVRDPARLWERRRSHADFLRVRIGTGELPWFRLSLPVEHDPVHPYDPIMQAEADAVVTHYSTLLDMPVTVGLDRAGQVSVVGDRADVLAVARTMLLQLAALHAPDDLLLAAAFPESAAADWRGFDLLPHTVDARLFDGPVPARRVASSTPGLLRVLGGEIGGRAQTAATSKRSIGRTDTPSGSRLVVFCDDYGHLASALPVPDPDLTLDDLQITTVHLLSDRLHEPSDVRLRITVVDGVATVSDSRATVPATTDAAAVQPAPAVTATVDDPSPQLFGTLARSLTPLRLSLSAVEEADSDRPVAITELLGLGDLDDIGPGLWRPRSPRDFLRVPIGLDDYGAPVLLDLKESAELGMGPHGICIGATGSGKSEMLRTLVLALALSHAPEDLAMVLVDYKGGAAFAPFTGLPHVAGIIDNLAEDPQLTQRARSSIAGEVVRRQEQLRDAGSSSISHYRALRAERGEMAPMPHLFVVIDEFGELLTAEPDFIDLLISIGRIGRSIGVHLLLSSQRIEAGKLRGLDTYLSYRIGLRTFSASESSVVLDTPDAFHLPAIPGYGYLKVDTSIYRRFRSGYVSGPAVVEAQPAPEAAGVLGPVPLLLPLYNDLASASSETGEEELFAPPTGRALVAECVERLRSATSVSTAAAAEVGRAVRPVWLPPLPARLSLARVIPDELRASAGASRRPTRGTGLRVPLGLLDNPARQRQDPWVLDLGRAGGHHAIIGAPGTGRSTFLRTMAASLALTHTPREVSVYGMDLTGGGLRRIEGFPHVGGVATRAHRDRLLRLLEELAAMLAVREAVFRDRSIDSLGVLRARHAAGEIPELVAAEVVLLVDGLGQVRTDFEELEDPLVDLLQRGGSFGLHVVLAMTRWNELRMAQQPLIGSRFELRLNDPTDSNVGRKLNAALKADQPGRLLTEDALFAQVALPVLEDTADAEIGDALETLAAQSAASWEGPAAAPIRLLPTDLDPADLPDALDEPDALPLGLRQDTMDPALLDLDGGDQHLLVFGDTRSGKTTVLRTLVGGLLERYTPDELVIAVMDLRGEIAREVPEPYLGGHATSSTLARGLSSAIAEELDKRQSTPDAPGPRIVVVVDDFDMLASGGTEPLVPLLPYLPSARDLRLHVWLTRPVAGANRALYDLALMTLRDTGGVTLLLSGERSEGQIMPGVYAEPMVPGRGRLVRRSGGARIVQVAHTRPGERTTDDVDTGPPGRGGSHAA